MLATIMATADIIGVIAFAVSGALLAVEKNFDIFGILVLGLLTSFGGGVVRDLLLGVVPPVFFTNYTSVLLAVLASVAVFLIYRFAGRLQFNPGVELAAIINAFDAIGLGIFAVTGVNMAVEYGFIDNPLLCITVGTLTGIGGGIIRDIMAGEVPSVLRKHVYALAAILGAGCYYCLLLGGINLLAAVLISAGLTVALRLLATYYHWHLPRPRS